MASKPSRPKPIVVVKKSPIPVHGQKSFEERVANFRKLSILKPREGYKHG